MQVAILARQSVRIETDVTGQQTITAKQTNGQASQPTRVLNHVNKRITNSQASSSHVKLFRKLSHPVQRLASSESLDKMFWLREQIFKFIGSIGHIFSALGKQPAILDKRTGSHFLQYE